jgi:hypothetical protein
MQQGVPRGDRSVLQSVPVAPRKAPNRRPPPYHAPTGLLWGCNRLPIGLFEPFIGSSHLRGCHLLRPLGSINAPPSRLGTLIMQPACRPRGNKAEAVDTPARLATPRAARDDLGVATVSLYGRESEVHALDELLDGIEERGGAIVVRGEAGIGKSSLLEAARRSAATRGMTVLTATGAQSEAQLDDRRDQLDTGNKTREAPQLISGSRPRVRRSRGRRRSRQRR